MELDRTIDSELLDHMDKGEVFQHFSGTMFRLNFDAGYTEEIPDEFTEEDDLLPVYEANGESLPGSSDELDQSPEADVEISLYGDLREEKQRAVDYVREFHPDPEVRENAEELVENALDQIPSKPSHERVEHEFLLSIYDHDEPERVPPGMSVTLYRE